MSEGTEDEYPRPDFRRKNLRWKSLNGSWDFLFDDEDVGIAEFWPSNGLPNEVKVRPYDASQEVQDSNANRIAQRLASVFERGRDDEDVGELANEIVYTKRQIEVPFVFQTRASGIHDLKAHEVFWYERSIADNRTPEEVARGDRVLLRFGAVDYEATVWVNGQYVGSHRGGHVPFDVDITYTIQRGASDSGSRLTVRVRDSPHDLSQPRGKQYWAAQPEGIFYTPSSGIWQSVWLETVPAVRIADSSRGTILRSNDVDSGKLHAIVAVLGRISRQESYNTKCAVTIQANLGGVTVATSEKAALSREMNHIDIDLDLAISDDQMSLVSRSLPSRFNDLNPDPFATVVQKRLQPPSSEDSYKKYVALWTPEQPLRYELYLRLYDASGAVLDEVVTSTGMRSLNWTAGDGIFRLNGRPYFQALVLDQGYWPETGITPPSSAALRRDIEMAKSMGFNGCRKHQKVEDPRFLYWADRLGYIVWGEMANAYQFNQEYVERFNQEWLEAVKRDINHPCIFTWTPGNESWGYPSLKDSIEQRNHIRSIYYTTKTLDPTRSINDNCGWEHVCDDLVTFHDYSDARELAETCKSIRAILAEKSGRDVFVAPIDRPSIFDPGAKPRAGAPVICTEFGGVNIAPSKDVPHASGARDWGYTTASDPQDLLRRFEALVMAVADGGICCGFVYTQLTDIEQEANGLYSFDRVAKLEPGKVKAIIEQVQRTYHKRRAQKAEALLRGSF